MRLSALLRPLPTWRAAIVIAVVAAYAALLLGLPDGAVGDVEPLSLLPTILGSAMLGLRGGLACAIALSGLDLAVALEPSLSPAGLIGHLALFPSAVGVAWLRALWQQARAQAGTLALLAAEREKLRAIEVRRGAQRDALVRLMPEILAADSETSLLEVLARDVRQLVRCERSLAIYLLERAGDERLLVPVYADGAVADAVRNAGVRPLTGALGEAVRRAAPYVISSVDDPMAQRVPGAPDLPGSMAAIPLLGRDGPIGAVAVTSYVGHAYEAEDAEMALLFCNQAALALENLRLSRAAAEASALRRLGQLKDELMRTVSHELRTPLSYVYGYAELLAGAHSLGERNQTMAAEILRAADHMRHIVDDLLELGRIEAGQARLDLEQVDLATAVRQAVDQVQSVDSADPDQAHRFVVRVDEALPLVEADPVRLHQILVNLLTNAVRYSPPGTEIQVAACVKLRSSAPLELEIAVSDQGAGLTTEQCERIFEKFYRGDVEVTGRHPGAGLGLAISRGLVEAHGGRIWAESRGLGKGATLRFTLPASAMPSAQTPALPPGQLVAS